MNTEYAKFSEKRELYNPPVTKAGHFSNLPDVLVPSQHEEEPDTIQLGDDELVLATKTPPPTPPELSPGECGFNVSHSKFQCESRIRLDVCDRTGKLME